MDWLKHIDLRLWWVVVTAAGIALTTAATAARMIPMIILGLGILALGIGEWINHTYYSRLHYGFRGDTYIGAGYRRSTKREGAALDVLGAGLIALGLYRLLAAGA